MKAVKITKIEWNLEGLTDEEKTKAIKTLPTEKGFTAKDDFDITEKVPGILEKKYGYPVNTFSFAECLIAETIDELLRICAPGGKEDKPLYTASGSLSAVGKQCKDNLEYYIKWRIQLERKGTSPYNMPKILDTVMVGIENVTKVNWDKATPDEIMTVINRMIWDKKAVNKMIEMEAKKAIQEKMDAEDEDEADGDED